MIKRIYKIGVAIFAGLMLLVTVGIYVAYQDYLLFLSTPLASEKWPLKVTIKSGTNFKHLVNDLHDRKLINSKKFLSWYARSENLAHQIKAGKYAFNSGITPVELLDKIVAGEVEQFTFAIIEGWTFRQMLLALHQHNNVEKKLTGLNDKEIMQALSLPDEHPEGQFMPDTYLFPDGTTDIQFLKRAWQSNQDYLNSQWQTRDKSLPLKSAYEALILASIVEKETGLAQERPAIAGVFIRRLKKGMRLQTDPTVIYGMGEQFDGNIRRRDLKKDTPYNTYTRYGLPPTPIALAGKAAIDAVIHPADGKSLYFVAKGDGSHQFSATLEEHNRAVRRYQLRK